jgi:hypothetical protein
MRQGFNDSTEKQQSMIYKLKQEMAEKEQNQHLLALK